MPVELPNGSYVEQAPYRAIDLLRGARLATPVPADGRSLDRTAPHRWGPCFSAWSSSP